MEKSNTVNSTSHVMESQVSTESTTTASVNTDSRITPVIATTGITAAFTITDSRPAGSVNAALSITTNASTWHPSIMQEFINHRRGLQPVTQNDTNIRTNSALNETQTSLTPLHLRIRTNMTVYTQSRSSQRSRNSNPYYVTAGSSASSTAQMYRSPRNNWTEQHPIGEEQSTSGHFRQVDDQQGASAYQSPVSDTSHSLQNLSSSPMSPSFITFLRALRSIDRESAESATSIQQKPRFSCFDDMLRYMHRLDRQEVRLLNGHQLCKKMKDVMVIRKVERSFSSSMQFRRLLEMTAIPSPRHMLPTDLTDIYEAQQNSARTSIDVSRRLSGEAQYTSQHPSSAMTQSSSERADARSMSTSAKNNQVTPMQNRHYDAQNSTEPVTAPENNAETQSANENSTQDSLQNEQSSPPHSVCRTHRVCLEEDGTLTKNSLLSGVVRYTFEETSVSGQMKPYVFEVTSGDLGNSQCQLIYTIMEKLRMIVLDDKHLLLGKECVVCQDTFMPGCTVRKLLCGHSYHELCIDRWFKKNSTCPICRSDVHKLILSMCSFCPSF